MVARECVEILRMAALATWRSNLASFCCPKANSSVLINASRVWCSSSGRGVRRRNPPSSSGQPPACRLVHTCSQNQAGHNKWSKIKRKKAVADMERAKFISKITKQIASAVQLGGSPDPQMNLRLGSIISQARNAGIPKSNIENAIRAGSGKQSNAAEPVLYEGRGPSGYLLLIDTLTENKKRTRPEIRHILEKHGGMLGEPGSSSFMFDHKAVIRVPREEVSDPMELAIEVGAEDVIIPNKSDESQDGTDDDCYQLKCEPTDLKSVSEAVMEKDLSVSSATLEYIPKSYVSLDEVVYQKAVRLVDLLLEIPDVMEVYDNFVMKSTSA